MDVWLHFARGPLFYFSLAFMVLGLLRHALVTAWESWRTLRRAGDKALPYAQIRAATLSWLFPVQKIREDFLFSLTSIVFHAAIIIVPLFLAGHIVLWARGLGVSWPAIPNEAADVLTIIAMVTAIALVLQRVVGRARRDLSQFTDYALPVMIALPFATGFMVMHPSVNPFSFQAMMLVHVLSADLLMILIPVTKLSHAVLMTGFQMASELGWRWPADSGSAVGTALGKEEEPV